VTTKANGRGAAYQAMVVATHPPGPAVPAEWIALARREIATALDSLLRAEEALRRAEHKER